MKRILVFGTFDGIHEGHKNLLKQARELGDYVIAVVARDSSVQQNKGKEPKFQEQERLKALQESNLAEEVLLGDRNHNVQKDSYSLIGHIKPDIVCLGYDQAKFEPKLKEELQRMGLENVEIKILKPFKPQIYHSSILNPCLTGRQAKS